MTSAPETTAVRGAASASPPVTPPPGALPVRRLNLMRVAYALMGFGLVIVEWPLLLEAHAMPLFEGVVTCLLTAFSLLALLGLLHPVQMLPVLLFESAWKLLWFTVVAVPTALAGEVDTAMQEVIFSCALVVVVLAVVPWSFAWQRYGLARGDPWR